MRKLLSAVLLLAAAGCATNAQLPQGTRAPAKYNLIAVDGQAVPHQLATGEEVVAGTLILNKNGAYEMKTSLRAQMSSTEPLSFQRQQDGTYTATNLGVTMTRRDGKVISSAYFGHTLRVFLDGIEYLYLAEQ